VRRGRKFESNWGCCRFLGDREIVKLFVQWHVFAQSPSGRRPDDKYPINTPHCSRFCINFSFALLFGNNGNSYMIYTQSDVCVCMYIYIYIYIHTQTVCVYVCMYIYIYIYTRTVCVCVCVCVFVCTYTHRHLTVYRTYTNYRCYQVAVRMKNVYTNREQCGLLIGYLSSGRRPDGDWANTCHWTKSFTISLSPRKQQQPQLLPNFLPRRTPRGGVYW